MTTLEEISACPVANRKFWTGRARQSLAFYQYAKKYGSWADVALERKAFRKNMQHRRAQTWLDKTPEHQLVFPFATT